MSVNRIHIIGNMGKDPEMSYKGQDGSMTVTKVSVAVSDRNDKTNWFNVTAFGKTAEYLNNYGRKGRKVYVEGRMQMSRWQDKEGHNRTSWELVANQVEFLDSKSDNDLNEPDDI